jgi:hypothetical protein
MTKRLEEIRACADLLGVTAADYCRSRLLVNQRRFEATPSDYRLFRIMIDDIIDLADCENDDGQ